MLPAGGTLFFPGLDVLPTFAVYGTGNIVEAGVELAKRALGQRMVRLFIEKPIPFRQQNGGGYPDKHTLAPHIAAGITGIPAHIASDLTGAPSRQSEYCRSQISD
jgi:NAD(P)H dehydrogenase (quinone)